MLHPLIGFTPDGTPLGTVYAETWVRDDTSPKHLTKAEQAYHRKHTLIEEKESMRWVETLVHANDYDSWPQGKSQLQNSRSPTTTRVAYGGSGSACGPRHTPRSLEA